MIKCNIKVNSDNNLNIDEVFFNKISSAWLEDFDQNFVQFT
jgi:hypothetical protein